MDTNKQKAFVVHSKPYKETSLIVTFLTERNGKVDAVAKGAKRKNQNFLATLNLSSYLILIMAEGAILKPFF